jgi:hypothetical protein
VKIPVNTCGVGSMKWLTGFCHRNLLVCGSLDLSMSCFLVVGVSLIGCSSLQRATPNCMKEAFWGFGLLQGIVSDRGFESRDHNWNAGCSRFRNGKNMSCL